MIRIIKDLFLIFILSFILLSPFFCYAATPNSNLNNAFEINGPLGQVAGKDGAGYDTDKVKVEGIISQVITAALEFVGVIFLILAIYGGYIWMIARGNEEEVTKAKNILTAAVIGIVIVVAAYAISYYVIDVLGGKALKAPTGSEAVK